MFCVGNASGTEGALGDFKEESAALGAIVAGKGGGSGGQVGVSMAFQNKLKTQNADYHVSR